MKLRFKKIFLTIILLSICIQSSAYNETSKITLTRVEDVYFERIANNYYTNGQFLNFDLDGIAAYCIEPGVAVTEETYYQTLDLSISKLSEEVLEKIFLYAYYGYGYNNQNTQSYRVATQKLIWEEASNYDHVFSTEIAGQGNSISYTNEINQINENIKNHSKVPSFANTDIIINNEKEEVLTDTNKILKNYINTNYKDEVKIEDNKLKISFDKPGKYTVEFESNLDNNISQLIHFNNDSQMMITKSEIEKNNFKITIEVNGPNVKILKTDAENSNIFLEKTVFGLYNEFDEELERVTTNENGEAIFNALKNFGKFYIKEIIAKEGYELDSEKHYFEFTELGQEFFLELQNKKIYRDIEITKVYAKEDTGIMTPEPNVTFGFYNNENELVDIQTTDENGKINITLEYGIYEVRQLTTTPNYDYAENFFIEIKESGNTLTYVISNAKVSSKIKLQKIDAETKENLNISNLKFKIYDIKNKEYVCQNISYPESEKICIYETNENGEFITPSKLDYGEYYIEEIDEKINGYLWNEEKHYFTISADSEFLFDDVIGQYIEIFFENKEVKGQINLKKYGETTTENNFFEFEKILLKDIEFDLIANEDIYNAAKKLIYKKNEVIETKTTNEIGEITFKDLHLGSYCILETKTDDEHNLHKDLICTDLEYKDQYTEIIINDMEVENFLKKGSLKFFKYDEITFEKIENTEIEIYTEDNILIYTGITDENGIITIKNIKAGKYYIVETKPKDGYILDSEKIFFEILNNIESNLSMSNKKIEGTLVFTKYDFDTFKVLPNTYIHIYNIDDELVYEGYTNENGQIILENFFYGKYYILEIKAPEGYEIDNEKIYFELLENGEIVEINMTNKLLGVPRTYLDKTNLKKIAGFLCMDLGSGVMIYEKKKKK